MVQCGAAAVSPRKKSAFPRIKGLESCKKWLMSWFYVKNRDPKVDLIRLPKFKIGPPAEEHNWKYEPNKKWRAIKQLHNALLELKKEGMTRDDILRTFVGRRVCPLQDRAHKMCYMSGCRDPSRTTTVELSKDEIYLWVRKIAKPFILVDGNWTWGLEPYDRTRVAPKVKNPNSRHDFVITYTPADYIIFGNHTERYRTARERGRRTSAGDMGHRPGRI